MEGKILRYFHPWIDGDAIACINRPGPAFHGKFDSFWAADPLLRLDNENGLEMIRTPSGGEKTSNA